MSYKQETWPSQYCYVGMSYKQETWPSQYCYGGMHVLLHSFCTLTLDGDGKSISCPGCFTHLERAPGIHKLGGHRTSLNVLGKG